jgi:hypothetical protein
MEYFEILYSNTLQNQKLGICLDSYDLPKLTQEESNHLNRSTDSKQDWSNSKNSANKKEPRTGWICGWI